MGAHAPFMMQMRQVPADPLALTGIQVRCGARSLRGGFNG
jgi:hypothetical protein